MYPDFHYFLQSVFGINIPALGILKTFGFFVALAFIVGAWILGKELKRKAAEGKFSPTTKTHIVGLAATKGEIITSGIAGFLIGFKVVGLFMNYEIAGADPIAFLFSSQGNLIAGLLVGVAMAFLRYQEKKKQSLPTPKKVTIKMYPHDKIMDIVFIAAAAGFIGAKVFNALETWDSFVKNPIESLISSGGFTFYGGLITAFLALWYYAKKNKFSFAHLCDAAAPALLIAYAIGRLGCHFSGDGDWGIYNSAYLTNADGTLSEQVDNNAFENLVKQQPELFYEFRNFEEVPHKYYSAPSSLPRWMVAMNYKNNVNREGIAVAGESGYYNTALPVAVFPTPIYEFVVCSLLFIVLMFIRRKFKFPLQLFGLYLIFNGMERFMVEKIRVNHKYEGFFNLTQAEIISSLLIIAGCIMLIMPRRKVELK